MNTELHRKLRQRTSAIHGQLDSDSILHELCDPMLTEVQYMRIIWQYRLAYECWQRALDRARVHLGLAPEWRLDLSVPALLHDCSAYATDASCKPKELALHTESEYLGCAYVFRGARLGANVLLNTLRVNQQLNQAHPFAFFAAQASKSGDSWPQWMRRLEQHLQQRELAVDAVAAAGECCFTVIYDWFRLHRVEAASLRALPLSAPV